MIYELRVYDAAPGKLGKLSDRFKDHTMKLFKKHGMKSIGYWTGGSDGGGNQLTYMLAFEDADAMKKSWASFREDPDWLAVRRETESEGSLVEKFTSTVLRPTDYSPMQ